MKKSPLFPAAGAPNVQQVTSTYVSHSSTAELWTRSAALSIARAPPRLFIDENMDKKIRFCAEKLRQNIYLLD